MKQSEKVLEFLATIGKQRKWMDEFAETATDYDWMKEKHIKKMPLNIIPIIDEEIIQSLVDWKYVRKENPKITKSSEDEDLADGCVSVKISFGEHIAVDDTAPRSSRGKWYIFSDQDSIIYRQDRDDADYYFIAVFTSWVIND